jgi:hypothetical protein
MTKHIETCQKIEQELNFLKDNIFKLFNPKAIAIPGDTIIHSTQTLLELTKKIKFSNPDEKSKHSTTQNINISEAVKAIALSGAALCESVIQAAEATKIITPADTAVADEVIFGATVTKSAFNGIADAIALLEPNRALVPALEALELTRSGKEKDVEEEDVEHAILAENQARKGVTPN